MNIYIPTKGRHDSSKLIETIYNKLNSFDISFFTIVIEPQDEEKYKNNYPLLNYLVLPEDNKGISYVRNYIKNYSEMNNQPNYWQLDDDVSNFYHREGTKMVKNDIILVLASATAQFINNGTALGALEYQQLAWSATKELTSNSYCDVCVFVDNIKTMGLRYRPYVEGKEDRDFAMQVIKSGEKTNRTTIFAFAAPKNGSNKGGLKETFYDIDGREEICADRMIELWGNTICQKITKKDGRIDCKINWKLINSIQPSLF